MCMVVCTLVLLPLWYGTHLQYFVYVPSLFLRFLLMMMDSFG
jgi:hypothetical protein